MKRLVCCLDGTWNDDRKASERTNVVRLHRNVLVADRNGTRQICHYVEGIATTEGQRAVFLRGAIGLEVAERIRRAYHFLAENYEPGDEIYLFGFSRGAFEARSLASFVSIFGISRRGGGFDYEAAWDLYRKAPKRRDLNAVARHSAECHYPVRIRCVGVWDTVGNLGNPLLPNGFIGRRLNFHDMRLHDTIECALQALSIDETRAPFNPILWTLPEGSARPRHQHVEQAWFAGTHADVGGGWEDTSLSDLSLIWMAERVSASTGLAIDIERLKKDAAPDPLGPQHDSTRGMVYLLDRLIPYIRLIEQKEAVPPLRRALFGFWRTGKLRGQSSINERIHESALARLGQSIKVISGETTRETAYLPRNLVAAVGPRPTSHEAMA